MARFEDAIGVVLEHEGGYVNNPNDPGGETYYGISLRFLREHDIDIDGDGSVSAFDIRVMTVEKAKALYKKYFWDPLPLDEVKDQQIATKIFDICVNMGISRGVRILQRALRRRDIDIPANGKFGPRTLGSVNLFAPFPQRLLAEIKAEQALYYKTLARLKPHLSTFLKGWLRRAAWPYDV